MKWAIRIARIAGIDVYIHATFLLLLGWVAFRHWQVGDSWVDTAVGLGFLLALFGCVVLHELGHALAAQRFGIHTRDITLLPIGGIARLERMPDQPLQELWVAIAGPLVNLVIAGALALGLHLGAGSLQLGKVTEQILVDPHAPFLVRLLVINLVLVVFNLLPAFPMDGGRVLRAFLALWMEYVRATQVAASIGQAMALLFAFLGFFGNPMLLFIAFFVWIGAAQEAAMAQMKFALGGIPVAHAMMTEFHRLTPEQPLSDVVDRIIAGAQVDFPVEEAGHLVGILTRDDLIQSLARTGVAAHVGEAMQRDFETVDSGEMLEGALARLHTNGGRTFPVVQGERLVGLLTTDNVGELLMIQSALSAARRLQ